MTPRGPTSNTAGAMARENVDIVRAGLDAYNRGDREAMLRDVAPDFELDMSRSIGLERGVYGLDRMLQWLDDLGETFESHRIEAEDFIAVGDQVVVPVTVHARGRDGVEATARTANVYTLRDGAVTRICMYQDLPEALEAVGLA